MSNPFDLSNRLAVVTGAGKGIGRGIALQLANAGADVIVSARTLSDLEEVAAAIHAIGRQATAVVADVTNTDQLQRVAAAADRPIDIWVNNAGGLPDATPRYLTKTAEDRWDAQMDLNLKAVFIATQVAAENMETGSIINISSSASRARGSI
ncbi:MAG: SDR family NAD(P)-dependent oxidoreductase, partial [Pseudomonadales bacterium]|nr:SDR family NAD(P)-dependent oxidoreductase [Pseudomonadales bacterium]